MIDGLEVRSQTSSFFFKDQPRDLAEIAEQLRVNLIVEAIRSAGRASGCGSTHSSSHRRRRADLVGQVRSNAGRRLRDPGRDLARHREQASADPWTRPAAVPTALDAYDCYLRARALVARRGTEASQRPPRCSSRSLRRIRRLLRRTRDSPTPMRPCRGRFQLFPLRRG